jgi:hypothetical protein
VQGLCFDPDNPKVLGVPVVPRVTTHIEVVSTNNEPGVIEVGSPNGDAGLVDIGSTNDLHGVVLTTLADGTLGLGFRDGTNTHVLKLYVNTDGSLSLSSRTNRLSVGAGPQLLLDGVPVGGGPTINPTDHALPYRSNSTTFADTPLVYGQGVGFDGLISLEPDYSLYSPFRQTTFWVEPYGGTDVNAPLALYVENDVSTATNSFWPPHIGRVGNIGGYYLSVPDKTNTTAVALFGAVDPAEYYISIAVLGEIEENARHTQDHTTNFAVVGSVLVNPAQTNTFSAAVYGVLGTDTSGAVPKLSNRVAGLFDSGNSGGSAIEARTGYGATNLFKATYTATSHGTSLWLFDADTGAFQQVSVGAADSGGSGKKVLCIPN